MHRIAQCYYKKETIFQCPIFSFLGKNATNKSNNKERCRPVQRFHVRGWNNRWDWLARITIFPERPRQLIIVLLHHKLWFFQSSSLLNTNSGRVYFQVFHPAAFLSLIRPNVPLASCLASSCFSLCTTISSLFCILYLVFL